MADAQTPERQRRPKEETARLGREIYDRDIKAQVEPDHNGEYVAIDVQTGNWILTEDLLFAGRRLREQYPDVVDAYLHRVGHRVIRHFGGRPWRGTE